MPALQIENPDNWRVMSCLGGGLHSLNALGMTKYVTIPLLCCFQMESSLHLLRGRVYEALENRGLACECFRQALRDDVHCYEAFEALISHHMMTAMEGT